MSSVPMPADEAGRLRQLQEYGILDSLPEEGYDDIVFLASIICETPIALVSLVDRDRQWFKSRIGIDAEETPRDVAFCAHAIIEPDRCLIVPDATKDLRFADNPLVTGGPNIRFYAGAPLTTSKGHALGTLCVIDSEPRTLSAQQQRALAGLSRQVMAQLELRANVILLENKQADLERYRDRLETYQRRLEEANAHLLSQSRTDGLTGLANRAAFQARLDEEIHRRSRTGRPLSLLLIDVDHFKAFNDDFGHSVGDDVLRRVSKLMQGALRVHDLAARYGGEEFAVILPETPDVGAGILAERLRRAIGEEPFEQRSVTISIGVAVADSPKCTAQQLVDAADRALYRAKEQGRDQVVESEAVSG